MPSNFQDILGHVSAPPHTSPYGLEHTPSAASNASESSRNDRSAVDTPASSIAPPTAAIGVTSPTLGPHDSLTCQWSKCGEIFKTPEILYDHICDKHIGRKSQNNLCLNCQWDRCRTNTVKRDHITSHVRVHVPLKPHKCDLCNKSFKRPQDLKKHIKTHADDSAGRSANSQAPGQMNMRPQLSPKGPASYYNHPSQHQPSFLHQQEYFGQPYHPVYFQNSQPMNVPRTEYHTPMSHHQPHPHQVAAAAAAAAAVTAQGDRKRALSVMDEFLTHAKRRQVDPASYDSISRSLMPVHNAMAVTAITAGGGGPDAGMAAQYLPQQQQPAHVHAQAHAHAQVHAGPVPPVPTGPSPLTQQYALPQIASARTQKDLLQLDRILEQMQATVYESSGNAIHIDDQQQHQQQQQHQPQPQPQHLHQQHQQHLHQQHQQHQYTHLRSTYPPTSDMHGHIHGHGPTAIPVTATGGYPTLTAAHIPSPQDTISSTGGTPAVSPLTSSLSYSSGQSPTPSSSAVSPQSRHSSASGATTTPLYPLVSSVGPYYPGQSPPATLGGNFNQDFNRRYSNSMLQRSRPSPSPLTTRTDIEASSSASGPGPGPAPASASVASSSSSSTSPSSSSPPPPPSSSAAANPVLKSIVVDPSSSTSPTSPKSSSSSSSSSPLAVSSPSAESDTSETSRERDENYEHWLQNMRILEELSNYVKDRLRRGDFESDNGIEAEVSTETATATTAETTKSTVAETETAGSGRVDRSRSSIMDIDSMALSSPQLPKLHSQLHPQLSSQLNSQLQQQQQPSLPAPLYPQLRITPA